MYKNTFKYQMICISRFTDTMHPYEGNRKQDLLCSGIYTLCMRQRFRYGSMLSDFCVMAAGI